MNDYVSEKYIRCKEWIAHKREEGFSWDEIKSFCVSSESVADEFDRLQNEEMVIPDDFSISDWETFVDAQINLYIPIESMFGISSDGGKNTLRLPTGATSSWAQYKNHLLGKDTGKASMSETAVGVVEQNCYWLLNRLKKDTRDIGPIKGLVMGSVQSGKTANMIGLVSMAADYDYNIFIILSGTIENLRRQTRDRFARDLQNSEGVVWKMLDYTSNPLYMKDLSSEDLMTADSLKLNTSNQNDYATRYVFVCLKNGKRLENLINWLHSSPARTARMRIVIIDDEADQASVNTAKMSEDLTEDDVISRTAINQHIVNLSNGTLSDGTPDKTPFNAVNFISFTATPYANVLNEAFESSLYPKDFICTLPESKEYFGPKVIFGSDFDDKYPGMNIVRRITPAEVTGLKSVHKGSTAVLPEEFQNSVAWFLCAAAILRIRGYKKPISMLIHTTSIQKSHFEEYDILKMWLNNADGVQGVINKCKTVYSSEKDAFRLDDLRNAYPDYAKIDEVDDTFPNYEALEPEIRSIISHIENIILNEDKTTDYYKDAVHLCVDNCSANKFADEGTNLRIIYPSSEQLAAMKKAPVFIVMGGNTLSRGLTIEGLLCTYFARNSNQADTLMQMGRWFGYRGGYELLQRIWLPDSVQEKFELLEKIDEKLKAEMQDFMDKGRSPANYGPKIMNSATIAKFRITAKNKSQMAEECDFDFSGDSYETTKFYDDATALEDNLHLTDAFLNSLGAPRASDVSASAYVWHGIDYATIKDAFLDKYKIFGCSSLEKDIPIFMNWMAEMNKDQKYLKWNVAVAGDSKSDSIWTVGSVGVGKISRSKKNGKDYIDIGSLRSGRDAICDVIPAKLTPEELAAFNSTRKNGKNIISARASFGLEDTPLLLLYLVDRNQGTESKTRSKIESSKDIVGFAIVIAGESSGGSHAKTLTVKLPS